MDGYKNSHHASGLQGVRVEERVKMRQEQAALACAITRHQAIEAWILHRSSASLQRLRSVDGASSETLVREVASEIYDAFVFGLQLGELDDYGRRACEALLSVSKQVTPGAKPSRTPEQNRLNHLSLISEVLRKLVREIPPGCSYAAQSIIDARAGKLLLS